MQKNKTRVFDGLQELAKHVKPVRRNQLLLLILLTILTSIAEIISVGSTLPFLQSLIAPERLFNIPSFAPLLQILRISSPSELLLPMTIIFGVAAIGAGIMRLLLLWMTTRFSFEIGADINLDIYYRTLYQPYSVHISRSSSEIISGITTKTNSVIAGVIFPVISLMSAIVMMVAMLAAFITVDPSIALALFIGFGLIYFLVSRFTKKYLLANSAKISRDSSLAVKALQEGLGGIRDTLIDGTQPMYCAAFKKIDESLRRAQGYNIFINNSPRYLMEALGMVLVAVTAGVISQGSPEAIGVIPILGTLALGAQRLLPILQQAYSSWSSIQGNSHELISVLTLLRQPLPNHIVEKTNEIKANSFETSIEFENASFRYDSNKPTVIECVSLKINKGDIVGVIGATGSGKSTLIDILMGLLKPSEGRILVDGADINFAGMRNWQRQIAHVPQSIFLSDASIGENIAFGIPKEEIDWERVRRCAEKAQLEEVVDGLPNGYHELVGERGINLSGGQRQRIGIARALYKESSLFILDEATSALDVETEALIMNTFHSLKGIVTIVIIAHRLTTLQNCSKIIEIKSGKIHRILNSISEIQ
jgi:ABC-type multidrug transport system fused ATPase/permease subunit